MIIDLSKIKSEIFNKEVCVCVNKNDGERLREKIESYYGENLLFKINNDEKIKIIFPDNICWMNYSFLNGFIGDLFFVIDKKGLFYDSLIEFQSVNFDIYDYDYVINDIILYNNIFNGKYINKEKEEISYNTFVLIFILLLVIMNFILIIKIY